MQDNDIKEFLQEWAKNAIPITLNISPEEEQKALAICNEYLNNNHLDSNNINPLSIYFIISKLSAEKQIEFIQTHFSYIKENDQDIFLYHMLEPKSLSYFLSLPVLKKIKNLDNNLFQKIVECTPEHLFHGFTHQDYLEFYQNFSNVIFKMDNNTFINAIYSHHRCCYENKNLNDAKHFHNIFELQTKYNQEFITLLLTKYQTKIKTFTPQETIKFLKIIEDKNTYQRFIKENYNKINEGFKTIPEYDLLDHLSEINDFQQELLIFTFFDSLIKKQDIHRIIPKLKPSIVLKLYKEKKDIFNAFTLLDWLEYCTNNQTFNNNFQEILDTFPITDIANLFNTPPFTISSKQDITTLKYLEQKYRNNIKTNGILEPIDETTSIFSTEYFKNMQELKLKLQNHTLTKRTKPYEILLSNFILFLQKQNIINDLDHNTFKEIEKLFYRIVMGTSITIIYQLSSIEEITIFNRLGNITFDVQDFTINQLQKCNVKHHKQLYHQCKIDEWNSNIYQKLTLKLLLIVGFTNAKSILKIDSTLPTLEHLVGNINVKNITLNDQRNPILNSKIMHLLFSDKNYSKIKAMLKDQNSDLYKYFPRLFNEWQMIEINGKAKNLNTIIDFLKSDDILIPPKYYRLVGLFKFIGCSKNIVNEVLTLHDQILNRTISSIPRIYGTKDEYSYEILKLDDMKSLTVGNITNCCFTVLGVGYSCLKHAVTSPNGRILVIKKNNELIAHSWLWRNGDLLCIDNIETAPNISQVDFFTIYLQLANEITAKSFTTEGLNNCIKNITIGYTNFDKPINGIEKYPCLISKTCDLQAKNFGEKLGKNRKFVDILPSPLEEIKYFDAKNVQYLIKGSGAFQLGPTSPSYQDEIEEYLETTTNNRILKKIR